MNKRMMLALFAVCLFLLSSCGGNKSFETKSRRAAGSGEIENVIAVRTEKSAYSVEESRTVVISVGIGGDSNRSAHEGESMWLEINAEGCLISGREGKYIKEYPEYYEKNIFAANVKERFLAYPDKTPKYFEDIEITFPEGECKGSIKISLYNKDYDNANHSAYLEIFYASNGSVLCIGDEAIREVDENNKPVYAND